MRYPVLLTPGADQDLTEIYNYIAGADSAASANYVLDCLMEAAQSLSALPQRGSYPRELLALGNREFRQVFFKPYRLIYRVAEKQVEIFVIADGRRDMQALLARRLLNG